MTPFGKNEASDYRHGVLDNVIMIHLCFTSRLTSLVCLLLGNVFFLSSSCIFVLLSMEWLMDDMHAVGVYIRGVVFFCFICNITCIM